MTAGWRLGECPPGNYAHCRICNPTIATITGFNKATEFLKWTAALCVTRMVPDFFGYAAIAGSPMNAAAKSAHDCDRFNLHIH